MQNARCPKTDLTSMQYERLWARLREHAKISIWRWSQEILRPPEPFYAKVAELEYSQWGTCWG